ncbi:MULTISPECIES: tetratricopeptide repeat protein [Rhizobium]|uniref:tetratricopeptide repeat protein n=1 Tax=Rhizobium TaxID=379 RepID=UPI001B32A6D4|nr:MULTISPECIES: tetratricopeptide repeat protein [Rhizobium]MBX4907734.1 sel1 repeat family protein [Rhizobium bangladeshense]MBX5215499.1 sel1 repeat family protein [Rhizobium sp. NLR9a]MBX5221333.1 sel1 repeat family protein [Rhizobium sp. NLR8a]MBX5226775.1 sel1 repeat family protein [Rhizobium sp. NLR9b]MBX5232664.1 sel1 repeat family protein [Rhizobium sp. NLR4a]
MPILPARPLKYLLASIVALTAGGSDIAVAQAPDSVISQPGAAPASSFRTDRHTNGDVKPSDGVGVFDRMGAKLPDLPPEKDYKGPIDEAYGAYQRGYYLAAMDKALPRAQLGDPAAQTLIGEILSQGLGVKKDVKGAAFWYGKAAEGGDPAAMFKYALMLMEGQGVPRDKVKADDYMRKAAEAGNPSAEFNWAQIVVADNPGEKGLKLALPFYEKSAEQGIADSQYAVAQIYATLKDLPEEKKQLAREWMARAARAGFDTAELDLGIWLVNGVGGPRDYVKGFEWLKLAANGGNVVAQNKLAHLYINAIGTPPNPIEAAKWYVLSRRAGLADPALEDFYLGIEDDQQKAAIDAANKFRRR